jgi:hypothetical protein
MSSSNRRDPLGCDASGPQHEVLEIRHRENSRSDSSQAILPAIDAQMTFDFAIAGLPVSSAIARTASRNSELDSASRMKSFQLQMESGLINENRRICRRSRMVD